MAAARQRIFQSTNAFRREQKRTDLVAEPKLVATAQAFAQFMAKTDKYGHNADGKEPWDRAEAQGYDYCLVSENIAYRFSSAGFTTDELADGFVLGWKKSTEHRKNMLDPDVTELGVGLAHSAKSDKYYAVQVFGRPASAQISFNISNRTSAAVEYTLSGKSFSLPAKYTRTHYRCRPPKLVLTPDKAGAAPAQAPITPRSGDHFLVERQAGKLTMARAPSDEPTK